jgi:hypothetical protein
MRGRRRLEAEHWTRAAHMDFKVDQTRGDGFVSVQRIAEES